MIADFPGLVGDKQLLRQLDNNMRIPPGGFKGIDLPANKRIQDVLMALPYHEVGPAFPAFVQHVEDRTKQLAMVSNASVGEGKQDAPVGTTLALLEQATKVEASAFKRLHDAHAEEYKLLKDLFREDPEAMWRHAKGNNPSGYQWQRQQFLQALDRYELIPVSDPNNPTALHRLMKAAMVKMLAMQNPAAYDMIAVDKRIMGMANIDPNGLFKPPMPPNAQPDPMQQAMQMRMAMIQLQMQARQQEQQLKAATAIQTEQGKAADRASRERIEQLKLAIQEKQAQYDMALEQIKMIADVTKTAHGIHADERKHQLEQHTRMGEHQLSIQDQQHRQGLAEQDQQHRHGMEQHDMQHRHGMEQQSGQLDAMRFGHEMYSGHQDRMQQQQEAEKGRQHEAGQADLQRQHQAKQASKKPKPRGQ
jgi:hypothetical protein